MQIWALLRAAGEQNTVVSQSRNRIHSRSVIADIVQTAHNPRSPQDVRDMETGVISPGTVSSMITDSITMIVVECPRLPQGAGRMCLASRMTGALIVVGEGFQSTPEGQALMQDPSSFKD